MPNIYDGIGGEGLVEEVNYALDLRGGLKADGKRGGEQTIEGAIKATNMIKVDGDNFYSYKEDYITKFMNSEANVRRDFNGNIVYYADREPISSYEKYFRWTPSVYSNQSDRYANCYTTKNKVDTILENSITSLSTFRIGVKNEDYHNGSIAICKNYYLDDNVIGIGNFSMTDIKNSLGYYISSPITLSSSDIFSNENLYNDSTRGMIYKISFAIRDSSPDEILSDGVALFFNDTYL